MCWQEAASTKNRVTQFLTADFSLSFKASLSAKSWVSLFIHVENRTNYYNKNVHLLRLALKKGLRKLGNGLFFVGCTDEGRWGLNLQSTPLGHPFTGASKSCVHFPGGRGLNTETRFTGSLSLFFFFILPITLRSSIASRQNSWLILFL